MAKTEAGAIWKLSPKQMEALRLLRQDNLEELLFGGAKGGGKSVLGCRWSYWYAQWIAQKYKVKMSKNPLPVGFMGRKQSVDFTDTTLETWKKFIPAQNYRIRSQDKEILILDSEGRPTVKICYGGFDREETINKFNSAEYAYFFIDQAEELTKDDILLLRASLRLKINDRDVPNKGLLTANPAQCWLKPEFIDKPNGSKRFLQALPSDNPFLHKGYIDHLKNIFQHRPELLEAYLYGSWDALEGADQIIKAEWVRQAASRIIFWPEIKKLLCCDTARFGDDETVIYYLENTEITDEMIMAQSRSVDISNRLATLSVKHDNCPCAIEATGADLGAAVVDELGALGKNVIVFNPSGKSSEPERYYNLRAEAWSKAAKMFAGGEVQLKNQEETLAHQLCVPRYKFKAGKTLIEPKDEIKKRLGRSPDRADAYIIGLWALDKVESGLPQRFEQWRGETNMADSYSIESVL